MNNKQQPQRGEKIMDKISYRAGIKDENGVKIKAHTRSVGGLIRGLKKQAGIDCRSVHNKQVIFSEFVPGAWGIFFYRKENGHLDAWIEFGYKQ